MLGGSDGNDGSNDGIDVVCDGGGEKERKCNFCDKPLPKVPFYIYDQTMCSALCCQEYRKLKYPEKDNTKNPYTSLYFNDCSNGPAIC